MSSDLKQKAREGVFWTAGVEILNRGLAFLATIVLARLLLPSDFGTIAVITVFISIAGSLAQSGMMSSLIRAEQVDEDDYSSVFVFNLVTSIVIYLGLYVAAPWVASFFNQALIVSVLRVLGLIIVIQAFSAIHIARLNRGLAFKSLAFINVVATIIGTIGGIWSAIVGLGVWSLVIQALLSEIARVLVLIIMPASKYSFSVQTNKIKKHFDFGVKLAASGLLNTVFQEIYTFIIGRQYSISQLGYYSRANSLSMYPGQTLSAIIHRVSFPLLSKIQEDDQRLINVQQRIIRSILFVIAPIYIISAVVAEPLFRFVLTDKWMAAVPLFQVLVINGLLYPIHAFNLQVVGVKGRSDLFLQAELWKKAVTIIFIAIAIYIGGIMPLIVGSVLASAISLIINMHYSSKVIPLSVIDQLRDLLPVSLFLLASIGVIWSLYQFIQYWSWGDLANILSVTGLGILSYGLLAHMIQLRAYLDAISFIR